MFRDTKKALERLEAELLAAERQDAADAEADALLERFLREEDDDGILFDDEDYEDYPEPVYHNYSNNYGRNIPSYNTDQSDEDMEEYSDDVYEGTDSLKGLMITALLLLCGICGMLCFWYFRYLW